MDCVCVLGASSPFQREKTKQNKTNKQIKEKTTGRSLYKRQLFALNDKYYIKAHMDY